MTRFRGTVEVWEDVLIEAKDLNDFKKQVKELWLDIHDIDLHDSEITQVEEVEE
tara:strand:+ start:1085 stop:1246 length:162 start_codon:yes stop_codon:yes gene_type:complete